MIENQDEELRTYLVSYNHEGARWNLMLKARDIADARVRLSRLCLATLDGEVVAMIPVPRGWLGIIVGRIFGSVQNFFVRKP